MVTIANTAGENMRLEGAINDCTCDILDYGSGTYEIKFCPRHAAADEMYSALVGLTSRYIANQNTKYEFISCITPEGIPDYWQKAKDAIALAQERKKNSA